MRNLPASLSTTKFIIQNISLDNESFSGCCSDTSNYFTLNVKDSSGHEWEVKVKFGDNAARANQTKPYPVPTQTFTPPPYPPEINLTTWYQSYPFIGTPNRLIIKDWDRGIISFNILVT